jgi:GTP-binding protein HflX
VSLFLERHAGGERALLVHLNLAGEREQDDLAEFENLVQSAGCFPVDVILGSRAAPDPKWFVGSGKLGEVASHVRKLAADVVIFNHSLSASQERNLEIKLCCKVIDRTTLILDIFSQRARTHEGKLQVELAQLQHLSTRLIRGWTHLERQQGNWNSGSGRNSIRI